MLLQHQMIKTKNHILNPLGIVGTGLLLHKCLLYLFTPVQILYVSQGSDVKTLYLQA